MNGVAVRVLSIKDGELERKFLSSVPQIENGFYNPARLADLSDESSFAKWLIDKDNESNSISLKEGSVPQTIFWIEKENEIVGLGKVRHCLNNSLRTIGGGHIGIGGITVENRGKGIGTQALHLFVNYLRNLGETDILLTVHEENIGSRTIIEKNGGILEKIIDDSRDKGKRLMFYWIKD